MCRITMGNLRVTIGHLRVTVGHPRVTIGHLRATMGHLRLTIGYLKATVVHIRVTLGHLKVTIGNFFSELHPKVRPTCFKYVSVKIMCCVLCSLEKYVSRCVCVSVNSRYIYLGYSLLTICNVGALSKLWQLCTLYDKLMGVKITF